MDILREEVTPQGFKTWIQPIIPVTHVDEQLILRVPSQFFFEWLEANFKDKIYNAVKRIFGIRTRIEYSIASTPDQNPQELSLADDPESDASEPQATLTSEEQGNESLDDRYHFENFLVDNDNELALRAAQTVSKHPGKTDFNPLLLYGDTGCGKTHLLNAIGNYIQTHKKKKKIKLIRSESFLNDYIYALQNKSIDLFQKKYAKVDVFLLDDLQFLSNKMKSQEVLYYLLSEFERKRKQIVITCNEPPSQLVGFDKRLLAFLQRGLIIDLIPSSPQTRLKWMDMYCQRHELSVLPEVRQFLAHTTFDGMHQLRAVMVRITAQTSLLGKPVSLNKAKQILTYLDGNWAERNGHRKKLKPVNIEQIIRAVSQQMNVAEDLIIGKSRQREAAYARQIAMYLAKEFSGKPYKVIGYHFGDRHYTSVLHSYKKISEELKSNPMLNNLLKEIKNRLL
ncbi:MAG: chromosomal replication initiator protein DnaA [Calditrichia bacterium]